MSNDSSAAFEFDRSQFIGGSDIAAIMGLGAYGQTAYTKWLEKTGQQIEEIGADKQKFFARRKRWESPIVEMLKEEFGGDIIAMNRRYTDPESPFLSCEVDFEWADQDGVIQNGEIKTVSSFAFGERFGWGEAGTADCPVNYAAQAMWGLGLTGRNRCVLAAMVGIDNMLFYSIDFDADTFTAMRAEAVRFWNEHVLARISPDPQTMRDMKLIMDRIGGRPVELTDAMVATLDRLREARETARMLTAEGSGVIDQLAFEIGEFVLKSWGYPISAPDPEPTDNAILIFGGKKIASWNRQRGAFLDQKRLKSEKPEIIREYSKEHFYRVLRFPKKP